MKKQLKSSGNGWVLAFSKSLLKILGYNPNDIRVLMTVKNGILYIQPIKDEDLEKYTNNMVRKFQKNGGGYGLYFPTTMLEILNVNPEQDFLDIEIDEDKLIIKKANYDE
ncbi:MAG: hypothetical protein R3Y28_01995 [Candidatus Gastranaerophilales bacterium]